MKKKSDLAREYWSMIMRIFRPWSKNLDFAALQAGQRQHVEVEAPVLPYKLPNPDSVTPVDTLQPVGQYQFPSQSTVERAAQASAWPTIVDAGPWLAPSFDGELLKQMSSLRYNSAFGLNISQQFAEDFKRVFERDEAPILLSEFILMWLDLNHSHAQPYALHERWANADNLNGHRSGPETFRVIMQGTERLTFNLEHDMLSINQAILLENVVKIYNTHLEFQGTLSRQEIRWVVRLQGQASRLFSEKAVLRLAELIAQLSIQ